VRSLVVLGAAHPIAVRREALRHPRGQGRATLGQALEFQLPLWPEHSLSSDGAERVLQLMRDWSAPRWAATPDFAEVAAHNQRAMLVPTVAHCALEYYRWALRSQLRAEGRRFAAAVDRPVEVPLLQIHGVADPCVLPSTALASQRWAGTHARFELLDEVGHFPHHESPSGTTDLITRFLAR
jgi:pimeloyl-ACP methyl ester carboxylesterase